MSEVSISYVPDSGKQSSFHDDRELFRYRGVFTGKGGGKTLMGLAEVIWWAMSYPGCVGWAGEPSFPMVERNLIPTLEMPELLNTKPFWASPLVSKYNQQKHKIEWVNGSVTWLGGLEYPESVEGANYDYFFIDEARLVRYFLLAWQTLTARLRGSGNLPGGVQPRGWIATTPSPKGSEMYMTFGDPVERNPSAKSYHWSQLDNPHLTEEYLRDMDAVYKDEEERKAMIGGDWPNLSTGSWAFDWDVHVIREDPDPSIIRKTGYGEDWGWDNPYSLLAVQFDYDNRAYVLDEVYGTHIKDHEIDEHCLEFKKKYGEGTFWTGHEEPKTVLRQKSKGIGARANATKRDEGISHVGSMFPLSHDDKPRIYIHIRCKGLLKEIVEYDASSTGVNKKDDHSCDALRYCLINEFTKPKALFGGIRSPYGGRKKRRPGMRSGRRR